MRFTGAHWYQKAFWSLIPPALAPFADHSEAPHRAVLVDGVELDERIEKLVRSCWALGLQTGGSCQGDTTLYELFSSRHPAQVGASTNPHAAYICFEEVGDALKFKALVDAIEWSETEIQLVVGRGGACFANFHPQAIADIEAAILDGTTPWS